MDGKTEIRALNGLRGLSALWVLAYHAFEHSGFYGPLDEIAAAGYLGVDLFFVLSGYVLALKYTEQNVPFSEFLRKRLARIYPGYAFVLVAMLLVRAMALGGEAVSLDSQEFSFWGFATSLAMVQAWIPSLQYSWNLPGWSVSAEWTAYLAFPLLLGVVSKLKDVRRILLILLLCFLVFYLSNVLNPSAFHPINVATRLFAEFTAGILAYRLVRCGRAPRHADALAGASMCALFLGSNWLDAHTSYGASLSIFPIVTVAVVYFLATAQGPISRGLSCAPMLYLGRISYALYLSHFTFLILSDRVIDYHYSLRWGIRVTAIGASIAASAILYRCVERPAQRWILQTNRTRVRGNIEEFIEITK
ncbi:MAG: acyltransferase family protein [Candidatus Binataceae bacterium]